MLPKGLDFTNDQLEQIDDILTQLYWDTEAQSILLADITGQLISVLGESNINTSVLSALAAGNLAATKEMARLVGEPAASNSCCTRENSAASIYRMWMMN